MAARAERSASNRYSLRAVSVHGGVARPARHLGGHPRVGGRLPAELGIDRRGELGEAERAHRAHRERVEGAPLHDDRAHVRGLDDDPDVDAPALERGG
jgi:hypothetical protein